MVDPDARSMIAPHSHNKRSNSSMVDPDRNLTNYVVTISSVQIPLWSILTRRITFRFSFHFCSNSSMVDPDAVNNFLTFCVNPRSNSSMVDPDLKSKVSRTLKRKVQIPLWSILTTIQCTRHYER